MTIIIRGVSTTPKWETIQRLVEEIIGDGLLTRISRVDNGYNYRAPGAYVVDFMSLPTGDIVPVNILITEKE